MTSPSQPTDLATDFFQRRVEGVTAAALARVTSELESLGSTPAGEALFASFERDTRAMELFGAEMALKQIVEVFKALFSASLSPEEALAAGAAQGPTIQLELTPEAREREYRSVYPALFSKAFPSGAPDDLPPSVSTSQTFIFADGSAIAISASDSEAHRLNSRLLSLASSRSDLIGVSGSRTNELAEAFASMTQQIQHEILSNAETLSAEDIQARADEASFKAIQSILMSRSVVAPMGSLRTLADSLAQRMSDQGAWKPGVSARLDGIDQPTPQAFIDALPTPELDASRQADALIAAARAKPRGPKP